MPIKGATIVSGGTIAVTGGTSSTLTTSAQTIPNGVQVQNAAVTDMRIRPTLTAKVRPAKLQVDGSWSKQKVDVTIVKLKIIADGTIAFPVLRQSLELHPEMTTAEIKELCDWGAQVMFDADFTGLVQVGTVD
jgi:hypothetical protein